MKKLICVFLVAVTVLSCVACGAETEPAGQESTSSQAEPSKEAKNKVDVDLTKMNFTMAYAEFNDICSKVSEYEGKTIKTKGRFSVFPGEGRDYYACVWGDTTACCQVAFEFLTPDGKYPEEGKDFVVSGVLETYFEGQQMYIQLANAVIE